MKTNRSGVMSWIRGRTMWLLPLYGLVPAGGCDELETGDLESEALDVEDEVEFRACEWIQDLDYFNGYTDNPCPYDETQYFTLNGTYYRHHEVHTDPDGDGICEVYIERWYLECEPPPGPGCGRNGNCG